MQALYEQLVAGRAGEDLKDGTAPLPFEDAVASSHLDRFAASRKYASRLGLRATNTLGHVFVNGRYSAVDQVSQGKLTAKPSAEILTDLAIPLTIHPDNTAAVSSTTSALRSYTELGRLRYIVLRPADQS